MPTLDRGTHRIHYEITGKEDAPPLLLVMGLAVSSRAWDKLPERLAAHHRVIVFDNRGVGKSTRPRGPFRIKHMADDAAAVLDAVGVSRANVFGISMGGMISIELALRHPSRIEKLALGCTHGSYIMSHKPAWSTVHDLTLGSLFAKKFDFRRTASFLVSDEWYENNQDAFKAWMKNTGRPNGRTILHQLRAILLHHAEPRLNRIKVPTLVMTGDRDRLVPPKNSKRLAKKIPGARLEILAGAGHCFPNEREDNVVALLDEFFLGTKKSATTTSHEEEHHA
jgi:pimeloyl-ACP methyl ester carboxylesterase